MVYVKAVVSAHAGLIRYNRVRTRQERAMRSMIASIVLSKTEDFQRSRTIV